MADRPTVGEIASPDAPPATVALARQLSRGSPSADLLALTEGKLGKAAAIAAGYADAANATSTRDAHARLWAEFET